MIYLHVYHDIKIVYVILKLKTIDYLLIFVIKHKKFRHTYLLIKKLTIL